MILHNRGSRWYLLPCLSYSEINTGSIQRHVLVPSSARVWHQISPPPPHPPTHPPHHHLGPWSRDHPWLCPLRLFTCCTTVPDIKTCFVGLTNCQTKVKNKTMVVVGLSYLFPKIPNLAGGGAAVSFQEAWRTPPQKYVACKDKRGDV